MSDIPTLHLIAGLPASGKSTLAAALAAETGAVRLTPDVWMSRLGFDGYDVTARSRIEALHWDLTQTLLAKGVSVILETGFWTRAERDLCRDRATELGVRSKLHFADAPLEELVRRLTLRNADLPPDTFRVEPEHLAEWSVLFERPQPDELV